MSNSSVIRPAKVSNRARCSLITIVKSLRKKRCSRKSFRQTCHTIPHGRPLLPCKYAVFALSGMLRLRKAWAISGVFYVPKNCRSSGQKTWRVNFFVLVRKFFTSRAKTKKFTRVFSAKHEPQSSIFRIENSFRPHVTPFILFVPLAGNGGQKGK